MMELLIFAQNLEGKSTVPVHLLKRCAAR